MPDPKNKRGPPRAAPPPAPPRRSLAGREGVPESVKQARETATIQVGGVLCEVSWPAWALPDWTPKRRFRFALPDGLFAVTGYGIERNGKIVKEAAFEGTELDFDDLWWAFREPRPFEAKRVSDTLYRLDVGARHLGAVWNTSVFHLLEGTLDFDLAERIVRANLSMFVDASD